MSAESYPRPYNTVAWKSVRPRPLLPFSAPPQPVPVPPALPSSPRQPSFNNCAPFILSTHIIPAAFPRVSPDIPPPLPPPATADKAQRKEFAAETCTSLLELEDRHARDEFGLGSQKVLWNCVNRYVKDDGSLGTGRPGLTLFFVHANGFPKEIWEPTLEHLLSSPSASQIDEIWCWESVQHGDAGLLNSRNLGGIFDWSDNTRDMLNFLLNYMPSAATSAVLPTHLTQVTPVESQRRIASGYEARTLIGIGHSYGGCTLAHAAINVPALFSSLILVDPVIVRPLSYHERTDIADFIISALQRRDIWPSREEAFRLLGQSPFFGAWDPAALRVYVDCGLAVDAEGVARLKTCRVQEAVLFAGRRTAYEVWELIDQLDEGIEIRWIVPGKAGAPGIGGSEQTQERVWRRSTNASNILMPNAGHLIAQESPRALAQDVDEFLRRRYSTTKANL